MAQTAAHSIVAKPSCAMLGSKASQGNIGELDLNEVPKSQVYSQVPPGVPKMQVPSNNLATPPPNSAAKKGFFERCAEKLGWDLTSQTFKIGLAGASQFQGKFAAVQQEISTAGGQKVGATLPLGPQVPVGVRPEPCHPPKAPAMSACADGAVNKW